MRCGSSPSSVSAARISAVCPAPRVSIVTSMVTALRRHVEEQAAVRDLEDVGAELAEPARDAAEEARPIMRGDAERGDAVLPFELADHDGGEKPRVDVAAAEDETDPASPEEIGSRQHGRKAGGAGALGHRALERRVGVDGALDRRLLDEDDVVDEVAHDRERELADGLDRDALGKRRAADRARPRLGSALKKEG